MTEVGKIKPVCHLVWMQGMRGPDDVEDYFLVADEGDKSIDGSASFPVYDSRVIDEIDRLRTIEAACKRLAYIVRKSVNSGPLSRDPTQEAEAWRQLRVALGEGYDERGNLVPIGEGK